MDSLNAVKSNISVYVMTSELVLLAYQLILKWKFNHGNISFFSKIFSEMPLFFGPEKTLASFSGS